MHTYIKDKMNTQTDRDESGKFVQASRGPLGSAYEAVRSRFFSDASDE